VDKANSKEEATLAEVEVEEELTSNRLIVAGAALEAD
jgi:hypothetical protein